MLPLSTAKFYPLNLSTRKKNHSQPALLLTGAESSILF